MLFALTLGFALLLGLACGSFLNVCIVRLPQGASIVRPRSHCMACGQPLRVVDNVPLLSFALLRGESRCCQTPIRWHYPLVEAATAAWFLLSAVPLARLLSTAASGDTLLQTAVHGTATALLGFLCLGLGVMDAQTGLLPNEFTLGGLAVGVFFTFAESFFVPSVPVKTLFTPEEVFIAHRLLAALLGYILLRLIAAVYRMTRGRPGMGAGDAKMLAMLGSFLGLAPLGVALLAAISLAGLTAVGLLLTRRGTATTRLPFGIYLAVGGMFAAFAGTAISNWYLGLFR